MPFLPPNQQRQSTEGKDQPTGTIHATSCEASAFKKKPKPLTRSSLLLINFIHCTWQNFTSHMLNDSLYLIDDHSQLN